MSIAVDVDSHDLVRSVYVAWTRSVRRSCTISSEICMDEPRLLDVYLPLLGLPLPPCEVCESPMEESVASLASIGIMVFITVFLSVLVMRLLWWVYARITCPFGNGLVSWYISTLMRLVKQPLCSRVVRHAFNSSVTVKPYVSAAAHTHFLSAATRSAGSAQIDLFAKTIGKVPYYAQMAPSDSKHGRIGSRSYHWGKDLATSAAEFNPGPNDIVAMVDVDMYIDIPSLLATYPRSYVISTFQPSSVAATRPEYSYTFDSKSRVTYRVTGGATYEHEVWNYGTDVLTTTTSMPFTLGLVKQTVAYNIDRRRLSDDHQLVLLTPIKVVYSPLLSLAKYLGSCTIKRYELASGPFLRLDVMSPDGLMRSTGKPGCYHEATIPARVDDAIASTASLSKVGLSIAQVKTIIGNDDVSYATVLAEYHRYACELEQGEKPDCVFPVSESVFRYQFGHKTYDPEAKPSLKPFMSPLIMECYAPDHCKSNDQAAVKGRILDVKPDVEMTPLMVDLIGEFVELLVPDLHSAHPVDFDTVFARQPRPTQRMILEKAGLSTHITSTDHITIKTFQKSEAYGKISDPRIISEIPGVAKLHYSRYTYSLAERLRELPWYAFGKTPLEVAERVVEIAQSADSIVNTDLSRFDGRVSVILRALETAVMMRYFAVEYHGELAELMASQHTQLAVTRHGVKYETGEARCSGSGETADFNTFDNAFMAYTTLRRTCINGRFLSKQEAWDGLGIYGGDDGITADVQAGLYISSCAMVGQKLEVEEIKRGDYGVTFLSRYYSPQVWHGELDSMCDVRRQLSKLHVTVALPPDVTAYQKLGEKCSSYVLSDRNTPVLGEIASMVVDCFPQHCPTKLGQGEMRRVGYYHALNCELSNQYPNNDTGWMEDAFVKQNPLFDLRKFRKWISEVKQGNAALLSPPFCEPESVAPVGRQDVVVNGDKIAPPNVKSDKVCKFVLADGSCKFGPKCKFSHKPQSVVVDVCRDFARGKCKFADKCKFKHIVA